MFGMNWLIHYWRLEKVAEHLDFYSAPKPSLFELLSQGSFNATLESAVHYVILVALGSKLNIELPDIWFRLTLLDVGS